MKALSRAQVRQIYEGKVKNWKELGGPDRRIVFFNKEPGRGTWEVFAHWLYGDAKKAPSVSFPEVGANEETRTKVGSTRGAISQLSSSWADGKKVFALGIRDDKGRVVPADERQHRHRRISPDPAAVPSSPMARPRARRRCWSTSS